MPHLRRTIPAAAALLILFVLYGVASASVQTPDPTTVAGRYRFERMSIAMPPGYESIPKHQVRKVNPAYSHIRSWISSVGASVAINDIIGNGRESGMCIVDTRTDRVVVTYTPTAPAADRFDPFMLDAAPLPVSDTMAPMGCVPGDFNGDGRNDFLVYYWGRTPVLFMARSDATGPAPESYQPVELVPSGSRADEYTGQPWNTNAVLVSDLNGDGHPDLVIGNYFPESGVLDPHGRQDVHMNDSLSRATNGGGVRVLRWVRSDAQGNPVYVEDKDAVDYADATGWTLALAAGDLTGDQLPEVYVANDFGHDHLLYNESTGNHIAFRTAVGDRGPTTPKSFVLGNDSFKGMGVDFVDLYGRGKYDMIVSNISTPWGLEESNFAWRNDAATPQAMREELRRGRAPFTQQAQELGMAWAGWCWDIKAADLLNAGALDILQTNGFVRGEGDRDRWAWLQELATANDVLVREPGMWPNMKPGDDLSGRQRLAVFAPTDDGRYANITHQVGTDIPAPSRGVAIGDTTGTGTLDFAVAYQWGAPVFYRNGSPELGRSVEFRLLRPAVGAGSDAMRAPGTPAYDASVTIRTADGRQMLSQLDGGSGHGGKRGFDVHFGLGHDDRPVTATLRWRDTDGVAHTEDAVVQPGVHTFLLTDRAKEITP